MRRRDVIKMGAAVGAMAPLQAADAAPARVLVVYDPRRPVSVAYARRWSAFGAAWDPHADPAVAHFAVDAKPGQGVDDPALQRLHEGAHVAASRR